MKSIKNGFLIKGLPLGLLLSTIVVLLYLFVFLENVVLLCCSVVLIFLAIMRRGAQIDIEGKRIREYISVFFFLKLGKWYDATDYDGFLVGNKSYSGSIMTKSVVHANYDVSLKVIYLRNSSNGKTTMLMRGSLGEVNKVADILKNDLGITQKVSSAVRSVSANRRNRK